MDKLKGAKYLLAYSKHCEGSTILPRIWKLLLEIHQQILRIGFTFKWTIKERQNL